jgi:predicted amidophosphoribosyltransferase
MPQAVLHWHDGCYVLGFLTMPRQSRHSLMHRLGWGIDSLTEQWIGWSFPPPQRAMDEAGWRPDDRSDYCGRCGDSVGQGEATAEGCATCRKGGELSGGLGDGVVRLGPYFEPLRGWVHAVKYYGWQEMAEALGRLLGRCVVSARVDSGDEPVVDLDRAVVVPMPMPWQRRVYRGVDHALEIARAAAAEIGCPIARIMTRANHPPQVRLSASERKRSGGRGLRVRARIGWSGWKRGVAAWPLDGLDVMLVDDVRTTGATLRAAARLLAGLKPRRIVCGVIGVSDSAARRLRAGRVMNGGVLASDQAAFSEAGGEFLIKPSSRLTTHQPTLE